MGRKAKQKIFSADFETTVYDGQDRTDVWAAAISELYDETDHVDFFSDIHTILEHIFRIGCNTTTYFHNLKFDGSFIIDYLLNNDYNFVIMDDEARYKNADMKNYDFTTCISDRGQWYYIKVKRGGKIHQFYDSLKLIPFSIAEMPKAFGLNIAKLDMEYAGERYPGWKLQENEKKYIKNDVLILKKSLEIMFSQGHNSITIGSCCLKEYRRGFDIMGGKFRDIFPDISKYALPDSLIINNMDNCDQYVRRSYRGGWCFVNPKYAETIISGGCTYDVNSLYPYVMHSMSGNRYPYGEPQYWIGDYIPEEAKSKNCYFFVRLKTRFKLKKGFLPCIQIKGNPLYPARKWLETSTFSGGLEKMTDKFSGEVYEARPILTLTETDYYLISKHYQLYDTEILDGCYFASMSGLFDYYINKYMKIKEESTISGNTAMRTIAKLFSNNLYGKMSASTDSSYKIPIFNKVENIVDFEIKHEENKTPGYIPVGSAITSYARAYTITAAQKNYNRFCYADTDSIHLIGKATARGIVEHDTIYGRWKKESVWEKGYFLRPKAYIEIEKEKDADTGKYNQIYNIKCAGMPSRSKELLAASFIGALPHKLKSGGLMKPTKTKPTNIKPPKNDAELGFVEIKRGLEDFAPGLNVPGKLRPLIIPGGTLLVDTPFVLREQARI